MNNAKGRAWVDGTLVCLQQELRSGITATTDCDTVEDFAIGTHVDCYIDNGFCRLGVKNWAVIASNFRVVDIVAYVPSGVSMLFRCGAEWLF
jgi:hypothetical protein